MGTALLLSACGTEPEVGDLVVLTLSPVAPRMAHGDSIDLSITVTDRFGNAVTAAVEWSSSDEAVATVNSGKVVAVSPGEATIVATVGEASASSNLTVLSVLAVALSEGVIGSPTGGVTTHLPQGQIDYEFSLEPGYQDLRVYLDGEVRVPHIGVLSLDASRTLVATASPTPDVTQEFATIGSGLSSVPSSADPTGTMQSALDAAVTATAGLTAEEVSVRFRDLLATTEVSPESQAAVNQALAGQVFRAPGTAGPQAGPARTSGPMGISLMFVNGVNVNYVDAVGTAINLWNSTRTVRWGVPIDHLTWFYNPTAGLVPDLVEAGEQVLELMLDLNPNTVAIDLANRLEHEIDVLGNAVVIVAHSQGNLMTKQAIARLPRRLQRCVGVSSVAAPPPGPDFPVGEEVIGWKTMAKGTRTGDLLLQLGAAESATMHSRRTAEEDAALLQHINWVESLPPHLYLIHSPSIAVREAEAGLRLHYMNESYLSASETLERIHAGIGYGMAVLNCRPDLTVASETTGSTARDPDGYWVELDGPNGESLQWALEAPYTGPEFTFEDLAHGEWTVTLSNVAENCSIVGSASQTVMLEVDDTLSFDVSCKEHIHLAGNGVTVRCPTADLGATGTVGNTEYTKRGRVQLDSLLALGEYAEFARSCTSGVTGLFGLLLGHPTFNQSLESWDVSDVENMHWTFAGAAAFDQPIDSWDVSRVTDMGGMFNDAAAFNQPIDGWDVGRVTDMYGMFVGASSFNQPLESWDVSSVESMAYLFLGASAFNQPIDGWDVTSVRDMRGMFSGAASFNQPVDSWDIASLSEMSSMFAGASSFNQPLANWDVSGIANLYRVFHAATAFNQDLRSWDVSGVTQMTGMFQGATSFNQPLHTWNVSNVLTMTEMFAGASAFNQPLDAWNVSGVQHMSAMFAGASTFNQPLATWDVSGVTGMNSMFRDASSFNQDLSDWCVTHLQFLPRDFDTRATSWVLPRPVWGSCPT